MTKEQTIAKLLGDVPKGTKVLGAVIAHSAVTDEGKQVLYAKLKRWSEKYRYKDRYGIDIECLFKTGL